MSRAERMAILSVVEAGLLTAAIGYYALPGAAWSFYGVIFACVLAFAFPINLLFAALLAPSQSRG